MEAESGTKTLADFCVAFKPDKCMFMWGDKAELEENVRMADPALLKHGSIPRKYIIYMLAEKN